ncbi:cytochrome P450 2D18 [Colletotrichum sojae]|uniref:Cytochrome P450 2D18 n=1 Tax=Colletotrichum sojae TaxID=2175907 RepID=A0A8H6JG15_9PEZI|nr:cytochrome P450 2D18 [Colletotrichum sojae]
MLTGSMNLSLATTVWSLAWIIPLAFLVHRIFTFGRRERLLPPGPPTIPILGNAHLLPSRGLHAKLKEWSDAYGSVYSLKVGRSTIVVLNDRKAIHELLNQQGALFNDRPRDRQVFVSLGDENIALMHESPKWKLERKIIGQYFSPKNLDTVLRPVQEAEISQLMFDLLERPGDFRNSVKRTTASIATITLYGHRAPRFESFWGHAVYIAMDGASEVLEPGTYLPVDQFPALELVPNWLNKPLQNGERFYRTMTGIWNEARGRVEDRRGKGDRRESLIDRLLDEGDKTSLLPYTAFNNFLGGVEMGAADTTATQMLTTILFLAQHPEFQEKARAEIDRVCGIERVPEWSDFDDLPYVNCIVKEGLRIRPVIPTGLPHSAKEDAWYNGMLIPAGSTVFIPPSALNHDSNHYSQDPSDYNPDRYLSQASKLAPELANAPAYAERDHYTYGAGRRMCPGIHLAERSQWRVVAQMLWAFHIEREADLDTSYGAYQEGLIHSLKEFRVRFVPRSEAHAEVVRRNFVRANGFLQQWD